MHPATTESPYYTERGAFTSDQLTYAKMDNRLDKLIKDYLDGKIDVSFFTDMFTVIYGQETDYDSLGEKRYHLFRNFSDFAARYSSNKEEIEKYGVHYSEESIKEKANEVWKKLNE
ncbi:hypothetical protein [Mariniradius sediminis]|uniref:Uncharacterized protein n=1 Tax=Mariniradius sediminis TaxID=2909237 RepID=A0ABS9BRT1_9BACT|nr:hypothetical protein [Mariniradius sediminis]MCF1750778.1 hypothetical protein [Mariniradius sediminis]